MDCTLRRSFRESGVDFRRVQEQLGHPSNAGLGINEES